MSQLHLSSDIKKAAVKICSRCIYDERVASIEFDDQGICNYCHQLDSLKKEYSTGEAEGQRELDRIFETIKEQGRGKPPSFIKLPRPSFTGIPFGDPECRI